MSWRRFLALLGGLSPQSRTVAAQRDGAGPARYLNREEGLDVFHRIGR